MDCLFCKLAHGDIKTELLYEDEQVAAFRDNNPQAPVHLLIVPKEHISTLNELTASHASLLTQLVLTAQSLAKQLNIAESGYRLVFNCNEEGGQSVYHIHLHLLGGRSLHWPPG